MDILFLSATDFQTSQWLFLRLMALSYFLAFWSLHVQVLGLYGSDGILPLRGYSDTKLRAGTYGGMILSVLAAIGFYPAPFFFLLYLLYLQFHKKGGIFLAYQWDILLVETGFMTFLLSIQSPAPYALIFMFWVFLFRFMFSSGIVKILSRCPSWKTFTAMDVHYESQPLPNTIAYYMHQLPRWFGKFSQGACYFIELVVPFFIFTPMPLRFSAFLLLVLLQLLIILTGNYAFFNVLTLALCVPLLSDDYLPNLPTGWGFPESWWTAVPLTLIGAVYIIFNLLMFADLFFDLRTIELFIRKCISPFRLLNHYGLFAVMTTKRNEIVIEGSDDGENWKVYEFKYKAGDLKGRPKQVAPHQPRLDWQMWFASLRRFHHEWWLQNFIVCLLKGSPEVLGLLETNPFPGKPPKYIRAQFYEYHFTTMREKRDTGNWWKRKYLGEYCPMYQLTKDIPKNSSKSS